MRGYARADGGARMCVRLSALNGGRKGEEGKDQAHPPIVAEI
jgi:hypothetical protein